MKHLYFIGNGFDLHHGFKTSYTDFRYWLKSYHNEAYQDLISLYGINDDDSDMTYDWWSTFEAHLVDFEVYDDILEISREHSIDYGSDGFREGDRYSGGVEASERFEKTMLTILGLFNSWIDSLGNLSSAQEVKLDKSADFITFNYTLTLESVYNIPSEQIHHIHGKYGTDDYVLGHGRTYEDIEKSIRANEPQPSKNLIGPELYNWHDEHWDESYDNTVRYTVLTLANFRKDTDFIIRAYCDLFHAMSDLKEITILGCSFSEIDAPYFSEAIRRVNDKEKLKFVVSWYSERDLGNIDKFFCLEGIAADRVRKIQLADITCSKRSN